VTDAEIAEALLLGTTCNSCRHIFWLLEDPAFECRYTRARRSHERDPATLNADPICERFLPLDTLEEDSVLAE
jgi:hypothetical protein